MKQLKTPYFVIAIYDVSEMTFTHVMKPDGPAPLEFGLPLHRLEVRAKF